MKVFEKIVKIMWLFWKNFRNILGSSKLFKENYFQTAKLLFLLL